MGYVCQFVSNCTNLAQSLDGSSGAEGRRLESCWAHQIPTTYGTMYGMKKTTLYLPDDLKKRVELVAEAEGRSEADILRDAISSAVAVQPPPRPRAPLPGVKLGDPTIAERAGDLMDGFGE